MALLKRRDPVSQRRKPIRDDKPERLGLGIEMGVERAGGEPCSFRQCIDARSAKSAGAETAPGRLDQSRPRIAFVLVRPRHLPVSRLIDNDRYMTIDRITIVMFC
jgi:hypothetical protein